MNKPIRLNHDHAAISVRKVCDDHIITGRTSRHRLFELAALIQDDATINLEQALHALYPQDNQDAALEAFRKWRSEINRILSEAKIAYFTAIGIDQAKKSLPSERICWFEGVANVYDQFATRQEAINVAFRLDQTMVGPEVIRPGIAYCWLYHHKTEKLATQIMQNMQPLLSSSIFRRQSDGIMLRDATLCPGDREAIANCDHCYVLLDNNLSTNRSLLNELNKLEESGTYLLPVALIPLLGDTVWHTKQIFYFSGKSYKDCGKANVDHFQNALAKVINQLATQFSRPDKQQKHNYFERFHPHEVVDSVPPEAFHVSVEHNKPSGKKRFNAIDYLLAWCIDKERPAFAALLGEYGMGKTTCCQLLAQKLIECRKSRSQADYPIPIYIDLRDLRASEHQTSDLKTILNTTLKKGWQQGTQTPPTADAVIQLVQNEGALIIFDGLDEVLVHLDEGAGLQFTRTLWSILPPAVQKNSKQPGKLLISCRTHYFRTLDKARSHFRGEDREGVRAEDYVALLMAPFNEDQIRRYLEINLPGQDPDNIIELFNAVHNLNELAERPYTLSLISRQIKRLEQKRLRGETIHGVTLYEGIVEEWLNRDTGKHQIIESHKRLIMCTFAAHLWKSGLRSWRADDLEHWLIHFLNQHPAIKDHYAKKSYEVLKEDLRTATFLVHDGEQNYRFAHTSLHEFFLARYLADALLGQTPTATFQLPGVAPPIDAQQLCEQWAMPIPSPETLDFLGQLLDATQVRDRVQSALRTLHQNYHPKASKLALAYGLKAHVANWPHAVFDRIDLQHANLANWSFQGTDEHPLDLCHANFSGANLTNTYFHHCRLDHADFFNANLTAAMIERSKVQGCRFTQTNLAGTIFRHTTVMPAQLDDAQLHRTQCLHALDATIQPQRPIHTLLAAPGTIASPGKVHARVFTGHTNGILSVSFDASGARIVSGSSDRTLRVWDAHSGECLRILEGDKGSILSVSFDASGERIVSGSSDSTLRVWDARSGKCLWTLEGHTGFVRAVSFDANGKCIVSGSEDGTLRVWDARSGECLRTLEGHTGMVLAVSFDVSGECIVSGSSDCTLRVWDAHSGECLRTLEGHTGMVLAVSFDASGECIVSGSSDCTLRVWDAHSGECLRTLEGHRVGVNVVSFDTSGECIVSSSYHGTLRVWNTRSGECLRTLEGHTGFVRAVSFDASGECIVRGSSDGTLNVWDARSGECLRTLEGHTDSIRAVSLDARGECIASGSSDGTLRIWDAHSGECLRTLEGHTDSIRAVSLDARGECIVSGSEDGTLRVWDARSGECLRTLKGHRRSVNAVSFDASGECIVSGSSDGTLRVWDVRIGECLQTLEGHTGVVLAVSFDANDKCIVSGSSNYSGLPDGTLRVWGVHSGECQRTLEGHTGAVCAVSFDARSECIVSGSYDRTLRVWDVHSGECLRVLEGHTGGILSVSFDASGARIVSGSYDRTLRVWDAHSGECLRVLKGHTGDIWSVSFDASGARIVSGSDDCTLRIWDSYSGDVVGFIGHVLPDGNYATLSPDRSAVLHASAHAWRWLGWMAPDADTGELHRLPIETYGSYPFFD